MTLPILELGETRRSGLLIDTNLLVLFIVGSVNINRIESFKRTQKYSKADYKFLCRVLDAFKPLYTLAHVMAEVNNLTDLTGTERSRARYLQQQLLSVLREPAMASAHAATSSHYERLGLVDAAIATLAREHECAVLTDDLDLYLALSHDGVDVYNFAHLKAQSWGL